jgi:Uma2 family endonuclease
MSVAELKGVPKPGTRMTVEEFESLNLSEDSSLILVNEIVYDENGGSGSLTKRNRHHARIEALVTHFLESWVRKANFSGKVFSGEVGCVLTNDGLSVGIDVALFSNLTLEQVSEESPYVTGPPIVAVEILSPSDHIESIETKIHGYLNCGVRQVWVISPGMKNVIIHTLDGEPRIYSKEAVIDGGDVLPGFSVIASAILD